MTAVAIRKKLVSYLQVAEEKKVKAIYALVKDDIQEGEKVSLAQYNKELEEADAEIEAGNYITHEEVVKRYQKKKKAK